MRRLSIFPFYIAALLLFALLAACGPAGGGIITAEETPSGDEPSSPTTPDSESSAPGNPSRLEVDASTQQTDANGIPVGFTQDGYAYRGDPDAPVLIEEFSDYQCPFCGRFFQQTLPALEENQIANGQAVLVLYDFPLTRIHPQAPAAHEAAHCAGEEGAVAYWAMHDALFENIGEWSGQSNTTEIFSRYAERLALDAESFRSCLADDRYAERIQAGLEQGSQRGVNSTPSFFINGQPLTGAQPLSVFNQAIATVQEGGELAGAEPETPGAGAGAVPTPVAISDHYAAARGNPDAPVTIVEYTDYECPYCSRHAEQTLPRLMEQFVESGDVYYIVKDFPLDQLHPQARGAAVAARCAGEQDAYWEMHDVLFARQPLWSGNGQNSREVFIDFAAELELDADQYEECLASGRHDDAVEENVNEGRSFGISGTPSFFIDGYPIRGAQPFDLFAYAIDLAQQGELAQAYSQPQEPTPAQPSEPVEVPVEGAQAIGDPDAPVTIVEYTDFQCPFCARHFQQTFPLIVENFVETGQVYYVFKDFPLTNIHPQAMVAAQAARCAADQEAYRPMHDLLFEKQDQWSGRSDAADVFHTFAAELGLDTDTFVECLESNRHEDAITADLEEGSRLGVTGTPGFFINGHLISGAQPYTVFEQAINEFLQTSN